MNSIQEKEILESNKTVCVLGDGNWGTAVANLLANNGYAVNLWCHNPHVAESINKNHINNIYCPNTVLNKNIKAFTQLELALQNCTFIFQAIPIKFLRYVLEKSKPFYNKNQVWINLSKGLEQSTHLFPTQIIQDVLSEDCKIAVLSGPSFAHDLLQNKLTAVDLAGTESILQNLKAIVENEYFKINLSNDLIGLQAGGAFKNVVSLVVGISQGLNLADNTKAYIFIKAFNELIELSVFLGAQKETLYGLSGLGDLILTAFGSHSKNLKIGIEIGQGRKIQKHELETSALPEGINSLQSINEIITKNNLKLPFLSNLHTAIFHPPKDISEIFKV